MCDFNRLVKKKKAAKLVYCSVNHKYTAYMSHFKKKKFSPTAQQLTDVPGPPASTTADPPTLTSQTPTTSTIPVLCSDPQAQPDLLVIVLPVAIGAFLIVVVIVALLVCICCMRCSHGKK